MKSTKLIVFLTALVIFSIAFIVDRLSPWNPDEHSASQKCLPTPAAVSMAGLTRPASSQNGSLPTPAAAATALPISKTTDLAPGFTEKYKSYVYVMHCDGTIELFLVDPLTVTAQTIPLKAGDVVLKIIPPESTLVNRTANVTPAPFQSPRPPSGTPYPPPGTPYP